MYIGHVEIRILSSSAAGKIFELKDTEYRIFRLSTSGSSESDEKMKSVSSNLDLLKFGPIDLLS